MWTEWLAPLRTALTWLALVLLVVHIPAPVWPRRGPAGER